MESVLIFWLLTDQPTTCPYCGCRTEWYEIEYENDNVQIHYCLNENCGFVFAAVEDEEFDRELAEEFGEEMNDED
jgi:hypothetical protein